MPNCATGFELAQNDVRSERSCSPEPGAISVRAVTCTRSSDRSPTRSPEQLLEFTQMTGDLVKAMRACAAADRRRHGRRRASGAGAILAMASRSAIRHRALASGVSVRPRRPGRLRYGRMRDAAANRRSRTRRANCSTPAARCRGRRPSMGLLQRAMRSGRTCWRAHSESRRDRARTDARACDDQANAARGVGDAAGSGDRCGGARASGVAWRPRIFAARTTPSWIRRPPAFEGN